MHKRSITVRNYGEKDSLDKMLRRLKRKMKYDNVIHELKKREYYMKPSEKRKLKKRRKKTIDGELLEENKNKQNDQTDKNKNKQRNKR